jgi:hypothetical protein
MKQLDFLVRIIIPSMRPLHHEDRGTKAYNDAIPIHLSEPEFTAFLLPHLSMPKRGLKCKLGYSRVFNPTTPLSSALRFSALTMRDIRLVIAPLDPGHEGEALLNRIRMQGQHDFE